MYKELINSATKTQPFLIEHLNVKYIPHFHGELELVYVLEGQLQLTLGSAVYTMEQEDICIIPPNCIHNLFTHTHSKTVVAKIYSTGDFDHIRLAESILSPGFPVYEELKESLLSMMEENNRKQSGYELSVNMHASNILLLILRKLDHYKMDSHIKTVMIHEGNFLKQVDAILEQHIAECIYLEAIAKEFNYTKSYFCRYFRKITGMTFWQYYTLYRLELAVEYIKTGTKSNMTEIAFHANFKNVRAFNKAFQSYYHCTPSEYKKMMRQK